MTFYDKFAITSVQANDYLVIAMTGVIHRLQLRL